MQNDSDSNARCIKAIELTFRFVLRNPLALAFFFFVSLFLFGKKSEPAVAVVILIVFLYFMVAYHYFGRGTKRQRLIVLAWTNGRYNPVDRPTTGPTTPKSHTHAASSAFQQARGRMRYPSLVSILHI